MDVSSPQHGSQRNGAPYVGRRALLFWRAYFVLGWLVVTTSTHWPRLEFQELGDRFDKFLHAGAFGVLAALLWQTRWLARRWQVLLVMAIWAAIDESTQALPAVGRSADLDDWFADLLGVAMTGMLLWATRPVPGTVAGLLAARRRVAVGMLLDRPMNWFHLATAVVLGLGAGGVAGYVVDSRFPMISRPAQSVVLGAMLGGLCAFYLMRESGIRVLLRRIEPKWPCLRCGMPLCDTPAHHDICPGCGLSCHPLAWAPFALPPGQQEFHRCAPLALQGLGLFILIAVGAVLGMSALAPHSELLMRLGKAHSMLPSDMQRLIDVVFVAAIAMWTYRRCRVRLADDLDRSGERCLGCNHDLRGLTTKGCWGICPECGERFVHASAVADCLPSATR